MPVSSKKSTLVVTAATVAICALVGSASAQVNGSSSGGGSAAKSSSGAGVPVDMGSPPNATSVYAHKKADAAMATLHDMPQTDADHKKAAAAMSR